MDTFDLCSRWRNHTLWPQSKSEDWKKTQFNEHNITKGYGKTLGDEPWASARPVILLFLKLLINQT